MADERILELLRRDVSAESYGEIRELWKRHSIAEDARDIAGLLATLTDDCVYELVHKGTTWEGHAGAERFYRELLGAFPDIKFDLEEIVIGPQGVFELARVRGTHREQWLDYAPTGRALEFKVMILFPWDPERRLFRGERIWLDSFEGTGY